MESNHGFMMDEESSNVSHDQAYTASIKRVAEQISLPLNRVKPSRRKLTVWICEGNGWPLTWEKGGR
jgi:hypothetical protein